MLDTGRLHQHGVLAGLASTVKASLKLTLASRYHLEILDHLITQPKPKPNHNKNEMTIVSHNKWTADQCTGKCCKTRDKTTTTNQNSEIGLAGTADHVRHKRLVTGGVEDCKVLAFRFKISPSTLDSLKIMYEKLHRLDISNLVPSSQSHIEKGDKINATKQRTFPLSRSSSLVSMHHERYLKQTENKVIK